MKTYRWSTKVHEKVSTIFREMQIKITVRYHLTPVRMTTTKKTKKIPCWRGYGKKESFWHCWWECKLVRPLWKTVWSFLKRIKNGNTIGSSNSTSGCLSKENKSTNAKIWPISPHVHCSVIYNSQDMETT